MKKLIRRGCFETNSSSAHSISLSQEDIVIDSLPIDWNGTIRLNGDEFGWEFERYNDAYTKANYMRVYTEYCGDKEQEFKNKLIKVIKEQTGAKEVILGESNDKYYPHGYIDHQSIEDNDYHYLFDDESVLKNFIFNKNSWLFTGNDNSEADPTFYHVPKYTTDGQVIPVTYKYKLSVDKFDVSTKYQQFPTKEEIQQGLDSLLSSAHITSSGKYIAESNWWSNDGRYEYSSYKVPVDFKNQTIYFCKEDYGQFQDFKESLGEKRDWNTQYKLYYEKYPENVKEIKYKIEQI